MTNIQPGDPVEALNSQGQWLPAVARSAVEGFWKDGKKIHDFPVIWVALPGVADPMPWPAKDVRPYPYTD